VLVRGSVLALVIALVARPLATFAATSGSRLRLAEKVLLGWAGLRGGVPVLLATFPVIGHVPRSVEFFDLVFFAVLVSTLLQGATVAPLARMLKLRA
jgi:cell volume regulation protein A